MRDADDKIYQSDDNNVDVIDAKTRTIQKVFTPLSADATTKDIYYDQAHHLLWVGTSDPKVLAIDPDTGKVVYTVKTASGMDQLAADTDDGLLFLGRVKRESWVSSTSPPTTTSLTSKRNRDSTPRAICPALTSPTPT